MQDFENLPDDFIANFHLTIGKNVKRIRQENNLSQLKLAYMIGYKSVSQISSAEIYYNNIHFNLEQLAKIAYVLDVPICEFFKGVDDVVDELGNE